MKKYHQGLGRQGQPSQSSALTRAPGRWRGSTNNLSLVLKGEERGFQYLLQIIMYKSLLTTETLTKYLVSFFTGNGEGQENFLLPLSKGSTHSHSVLKCPSSNLFRYT